MAKKYITYGIIVTGNNCIIIWKLNLFFPYDQPSGNLTVDNFSVNTPGGSPNIYIYIYM